MGTKKLRGELSSQTSTCSSNGTESQVTRMGTPGLGFNDALFQKHLSGTDNSLADDDQAVVADDAFVSALMSVLRRCIHESADFSIRNRAVFDALKSILDEAD